ncbi:JAB domain-containing protein [Pedobacter sp. KR3-3]|uniref:JAB domain-containing protein n=1 Tax=Pedobacter albus TaxID=3113905 RepID=A0ABU7I6R6_9SPHI|nr:JAB domain-containing protein [Pedobacter sp. KR3-3]MEE1945052.1 JAB domain-containing protein [Pedobacter sp. KR3-3]
MVQQENTFKVAEVEVTYRPKFKALERPKITTSGQAYSLLLSRWSKGKIELLEEFKVVLLNRNNRVLGIADISQGGVSGTVVDPKIIFAISLKANASSIILCHNHPSGNIKPSDADIQLTRKMVEGGRLLDVTVWDHLIISNEGYYSLVDNGMI